ncbi:MAG: MFS transporter, partial [Rhodoferax sp.]
VVLLPLWLQEFMGYTATEAGMVLAPVGVFALILSPFVGKGLGRFDARLFATFSFLVFALVMWMRSLFNTQADFGTIMVPTLIQGVAMAFFFIPLTTVTLSGLPQQRIPAASGLTNFVRITAGSFGTSLVTTLWENRATLHHAHLAEAVNNGSQAARSTLAGLEAAGMDPQQALSMINQLTTQQAYMLGANDMFYLSAVIFVLLIPLIWLTRPQRGDGGGAAAGAH